MQLCGARQCSLECQACADLPIKVMRQVYGTINLCQYLLGDGLPKFPHRYRADRPIDFSRTAQRYHLVTSGESILCQMSADKAGGAQDQYPHCCTLSAILAALAIRVSV